MRAQIYAGILCAAYAVSGTPEYTPVKVWETESVLSVSESVLFNPADNLLYVSCINGKPAEKNGLGFIAKVDLEGNVTEIKWATGLNAPKGMAIYGASLFVTDIDCLVEISLESGKTVNRYAAKGAVFLNDAAAAGNGVIYVSDSSAENGRLYKLENGKLEYWLKAPEINRPNGLFMDGETLMAGDGSSGKLCRIDPKTKTITPIAETDSGIDGLKPDGKGNWLTSNWQGRTSLITKSGETVVLMDTTEAKINAADFEFLPDRNLLIIPTFFNNRAAAFELK